VPFYISALEILLLTYLLTNCKTSSTLATMVAENDDYSRRSYSHRSRRDSRPKRRQFVAFLATPATIVAVAENCD